METLFQIITTLWSVLTMITAKTTLLIPEARILAITNWPNKMLKALIQDLKIRIRTFRHKEFPILIVQNNVRLDTTVSQLQEFLKTELIDNNQLNWILLANLTCCKVNHNRILSGLIIKIIKRRRRHNQRELLLLLKVMVIQAQQRSKLPRHLQSTTFLKQKQLLVKHFLATTLVKITNKRLQVKTHLFLNKLSLWNLNLKTQQMLWTVFKIHKIKNRKIKENKY